MESLGSIFNHALGPVTYGPSSSNTAGTNRIGYICRHIVGVQPREVVVEFSESGAFPATYKGMKSDVAFIDGLNGHLYDHEVLVDPARVTRASAFPVSFRIVPEVFSDCIEGARFRIRDDCDRELVIVADSVGGGDILVHQVDGQPISVTGLHFDALLLCNDLPSHRRNGLLTAIEELDELTVVATGSARVIQLRSRNGFAPRTRQRIDELVREHDASAVTRYLDPVYPVATVADSPISDVASTLDFCLDRGLSLGEAAVAYEGHVAGWSQSAVEQYALKLLALMRVAVESGLEDGNPIEGIIGRNASTFLASSRSLLDLGFLNLGMAYAQAVMEHSNTGKVIVCAPTGGATGIVPALLLGYADHFQLPVDSLVKPLMAAGLMGVLMTRFGNTFNGTDLGCQVEVGCAAAMAAAALTELLGGSAHQGFTAAAIAMQCNMGIVCDPVGGLVQIPCIQRNTNGVGTATVAVLMAMSGFDPVIPFDETFEAAVRLGRNFPPELKGSSCAGLCGTPSAQQIMLELTVPQGSG